MAHTPESHDGVAWSRLHESQLVEAQPVAGSLFETQFPSQTFSVAPQPPELEELDEELDDEDAELVEELVPPPPSELDEVESVEPPPPPPGLLVKGAPMHPAPTTQTIAEPRASIETRRTDMKPPEARC
jgi:hypothetical protein